MVKRKNLLNYYMLAIAAIVIISFAVAPPIIGAVNYREIDRNVRSYYDALIAQDYEKAYNYVFLYDVGTDVGLQKYQYTYEEGKKIYVTRMNKLSQQLGYRIISATATPGKDSYGGSIYFVELEIQIEGVTKKYQEGLGFENKKLYISGGDTYAHFRDGWMGDWENRLLPTK